MSVVELIVAIVVAIVILFVIATFGRMFWRWLYPKLTAIFAKPGCLIGCFFLAGIGCFACALSAVVLAPIVAPAFDNDAQNRGNDARNVIETFSNMFDPGPRPTMSPEELVARACPNGPVAVQTTKVINVLRYEPRLEPGTVYNQIDQGEPLTLLGTQDRWGMVDWAPVDGQTFWILLESLSASC